MKNRVIHFEIQADDIPRVEKFYEKVLGWKFEQMMTADPAKKDSMDWWEIKTGEDGTPGINGGLYRRPEKSMEKIYTYDCTILVEDIDQVAKAVQENGGKITMEKSELPEVGWFVSCLDTEGNKFALMQATDWQPK